MKNRLTLIAGSAILVLGNAGPASVGGGATVAQAAAPAEARCTALTALSINDVKIVSADIVAPMNGMPGFCQVRGHAEKAVNFDLKLPLTDWNQKFYMAGCGGFCGVLDNRNGMDGLKRGYAVITTDTGHQGTSLLDTGWVIVNPDAVTDFAHAGVNKTVRAGKALTRAFYDTDIRFSYFNGCSNGGRQALMEATRYPEDFDGIIAGAPGFDIQGGLSYLVGIAKADLAADGRPIFNPAKVGLVTRAVAKECGDATGLIASPLTCRFKPERLLCRSGDSDTCLTADEVGVLNTWYEPPRLGNGKPLFASGVVHGSEPFWYHPSPYSNAVLGDAKMIAAQSFLNLSPGLPRNLTLADFDFERHWQLLGAAMRSATPDSDLRGFKARNGKLLIYHGWGDPTLPPARTIAYYSDLLRSLGGGDQDTARLFMIPGMSHCANPPGVDVPGFDRDSFDALTTLENWVEKGGAPDAMLGTKYGLDRNVRFTRPICAYPAVATYKGAGDRADARNWRCTGK